MYSKAISHSFPRQKKEINLRHACRKFPHQENVKKQTEGWPRFCGKHAEKL
jgi:hypothetical protein